MTENGLATVKTSGMALAEQVAIKGDLAGLTPEQRMAYYGEVCNSLGLNPLTRPFEYINLNGKLTLYATRGCADQLRSLRGITITALDPRQIGDLYVVVATGRDKAGREDSATGAVNIKGLTGEALANAMMKAETKAKRRLTLSLAGLGWTDETEIETIPTAVPANVDPDTGEIRKTTLADRVKAGVEKVQPAVEGEFRNADPEAQPFEEGPVSASERMDTMTRDEFVRRLEATGRVLGDLDRGIVHNVTGKDRPSDMTESDWHKLAVEVGIA